MSVYAPNRLVARREIRGLENRKHKVRNKSGIHGGRGGGGLRDLRSYDFSRAQRDPMN